jgi:hypothetical protein
LDVQEQQAQNYYEKIFLRSLENIYSFLKQEKAWADGSYNGFNTYIEIFEEFISPCEDVIKWQILSDKQRRNLQKFYEVLMTYDDTKKVGTKVLQKSDREIYLDPKWKEMRDFGKILYDELKLISL